MRTLLILAALVGIATAVYHLQVFRLHRSRSGLSWRALVDPRPASGVRLTAAGFWGGAVLALAAALLVWQGGGGP